MNRDQVKWLSPRHLGFLLACYVAFALVGGGITFIGAFVYSVTSSLLAALAVVLVVVAGIALLVARIRHRLKAKGFNGLAVPT
jgi:cytochrome c biogenesis protein CcdA